MNFEKKCLEFFDRKFWDFGNQNFGENLDFGGNFQENLASRQGSIIRENELSENISTLLQPDEVYKYQVMQSGHLKARE